MDLIQLKFRQIKTKSGTYATLHRDVIPSLNSYRNMFDQVFGRLGLALIANYFEQKFFVMQ